MTMIGQRVSAQMGQVPIPRPPGRQRTNRIRPKAPVLQRASGFAKQDLRCLRVQLANAAKALAVISSTPPEPLMARYLGAAAGSDLAQSE